MASAVGHHDVPTIAELNKQMSGLVPRVVEAPSGWSATIFGLQSPIPTNPHQSAYALWPILAQIADWWEDTVSEAVGSCPEPQNARRQSRTKGGRDKIKNTACMGHRIPGTLTVPSGE